MSENPQEEAKVAPAANADRHEMARATDEAISSMLMELRASFPPSMMGAVLSGAIAALTRFQLANMPEGTQAFQVVQSLAPAIMHCAQQLVAAKRGDRGEPDKATAMEPVEQRGFQALQASLNVAPIPTFAIWSEGLFLVSIEASGEAVLSYASRIEPQEAVGNAMSAVGAHCGAAVMAWQKERADG